MFSEGFSEGQTKDINDGFPLDSQSYTEDYDYESDSDLEDSFSGEDEGEPYEDGNIPDSERLENTQTLEADVSSGPSARPSSVEAVENQDNNRSSSFFSLDIRRLG